MTGPCILLTIFSVIGVAWIAYTVIDTQWREYNYRKDPNQDIRNLPRSFHRFYGVKSGIRPGGEKS